MCSRTYVCSINAGCFVYSSVILTWKRQSQFWQNVSESFAWDSRARISYLTWWLPSPDLQNHASVTDPLVEVIHWHIKALKYWLILQISNEKGFSRWGSFNELIGVLYLCFLFWRLLHVLCGNVTRTSAFLPLIDRKKIVRFFTSLLPDFPWLSWNSKTHSNRFSVCVRVCVCVCVCVCLWIFMSGCVDFPFLFVWQSSCRTG